MPLSFIVAFVLVLLLPHGVDAATLIRREQDVRKPPQKKTSAPGAIASDVAADEESSTVSDAEFDASVEGIKSSGSTQNGEGRVTTVHADTAADVDAADTAQVADPAAADPNEVTADAGAMSNEDADDDAAMRNAVGEADADRVGIGDDASATDAASQEPSSENMPPTEDIGTESTDAAIETEDAILDNTNNAILDEGAPVGSDASPTADVPPTFGTPLTRDAAAGTTTGTAPIGDSTADMVADMDADATAGSTSDTTVDTSQAQDADGTASEASSAEASTTAETAADMTVGAPPTKRKQGTTTKISSTKVGAKADTALSSDATSTDTSPASPDLTADTSISTSSDATAATANLDTSVTNEKNGAKTHSADVAKTPEAATDTTMDVSPPKGAEEAAKIDGELDAEEAQLENDINNEKVDDLSVESDESEVAAIS